MKAYNVSVLTAVLVAALACGASGQPIVTCGPACPPINIALGGTYWHNCPGRVFVAAQDSNCCQCGIGKIDQYPGAGEWFEQRMFYEWPLLLDSIPYGSVIKYATLRIVYSPTTPALNVQLYKVQEHICRCEGMWTETDGTPLGYGLGSNGVISATFDSTTDFVDSLQACLSDALHDNYFSLGVRAYQSSQSYDWWTIACCGISLTIGFVPPATDSILITNVVHGVENYDK
jgi:hypothetical protein